MSDFTRAQPYAPASAPGPVDWYTPAATGSSGAGTNYPAYGAGFGSAYGASSASVAFEDEPPLLEGKCVCPAVQGAHV